MPSAAEHVAKGGEARAFVKAWQGGSGERAVAGDPEVKFKIGQESQLLTGWAAVRRSRPWLGRWSAPIAEGRRNLKTSKTIIEALGTAVVAMAVLLAAFMLAGPRFGWNTHAVLSGSMEPVLGVGGIIVTRPVRLSDVREGDIITFQSGNQLVTHRVVEISTIEGKPWFRTKGDANEDPDPNLVSSKGEVMRKTVLHLPYLGFVASFMKGKAAFLVLVGIPALILIVLFSKDIWKGIQEEKGKKRREDDCRERPADAGERPIFIRYSRKS